MKSVKRKFFLVSLGPASEPTGANTWQSSVLYVGFTREVMLGAYVNCFYWSVLCDKLL